MVNSSGLNPPKTFVINRTNIAGACFKPNGIVLYWYRPRDVLKCLFPILGFDRYLMVSLRQIPFGEYSSSCHSWRCFQYRRLYQMILHNYEAFLERLGTTYQRSARRRRRHHDVGRTKGGPLPTMDEVKKEKRTDEFKAQVTERAASEWERKAREDLPACNLLFAQKNSHRTFYNNFE